MSRRSFTGEDYVTIGARIRQQILAHYLRDSCVATARATVDALKQAGVDVFPLSVRVYIVNEPVQQFSLEHGYFPEVGTDDYPPDGYGIGLGVTPSTPDAWAGHVVVVAERKWLLDFSIDQANRPDYGIVLDPLVAPVTERWIRGKEMMLLHRGPAYLYYQTLPGDKGFKASPNWEGESMPHVHLAKP